MNKFFDPRFNLLETWLSLFFLGRVPDWMREDEERTKKMRNVAREIDEEVIVAELVPQKRLTDQQT